MRNPLIPFKPPPGYFLPCQRQHSMILQSLQGPQSVRSLAALSLLKVCLAAKDLSGAQRGLAQLSASAAFWREPVVCLPPGQQSAQTALLPFISPFHAEYAQQGRRGLAFSDHSESSIFSMPQWGPVTALKSEIHFSQLDKLFLPLLVQTAKLVSREQCSKE